VTSLFTIETTLCTRVSIDSGTSNKCLNYTLVKSIQLFSSNRTGVLPLSSKRQHHSSILITMNGLRYTTALYVLVVQNSDTRSFPSKDPFYFHIGPCLIRYVVCFLSAMNNKRQSVRLFAQSAKQNPTTYRSLEEWCLLGCYTVWLL
jgi:hypothetical protein